MALKETSAHGRIVNRIAGPHDLVAAWTQHPHHLLRSIAPHCVNERRDRFLGTAVALLREDAGRNSEKHRRYCKGCEGQDAGKPVGSGN